MQPNYFYFYGGNHLIRKLFFTYFKMLINSMCQNRTIYQLANLVTKLGGIYDLNTDILIFTLLLCCSDIYIIELLQNIYNRCFEWRLIPDNNVTLAK